LVVNVKLPLPSRPALLPKPLVVPFGSVTVTFTPPGLNPANWKRNDDPTLPVLGRAVTRVPETGPGGFVFGGVVGAGGRGVTGAAVVTVVGSAGAAVAGVAIAAAGGALLPGRREQRCRRARAVGAGGACDIATGAGEDRHRNEKPAPSHRAEMR
jgi:hypothetical protein